MRLRFTSRAATDLQRLRAFIAQDDPPAARRQIDALRRSIRNLLEQPQMGREIDESSGMRQWIAGYVVRYFVDDHILTVNRIWHGREERPEQAEPRVRKPFDSVKPAGCSPRPIAARDDGKD